MSYRLVRKPYANGSDTITGTMSAADIPQAVHRRVGRCVRAAVARGTGAARGSRRNQSVPSTADKSAAVHATWRCSGEAEGAHAELEGARRDGEGAGRLAHVAASALERGDEGGGVDVVRGGDSVAAHQLVDGGLGDP